MESCKSMDRRNKPVKWPLLALLVLILLLSCLACLPPLNNLYLISPTGFLYLFLSGLDLNFWWLAPILSILPLVGWLLLHRGKQAGKWIIVAVHGFLLGANLVVFVLHFITTLGAKNGESFRATLILALSCLVFSIPVLILVNRWYPRISNS